MEEVYNVPEPSHTEPLVDQIDDVTDTEVLFNIFTDSYERLRLDNEAAQRIARGEYSVQRSEGVESIVNPYLQATHEDEYELPEMPYELRINEEPEHAHTYQPLLDDDFEELMRKEREEEQQEPAKSVEESGEDIQDLQNAEMEEQDAGEQNTGEVKRTKQSILDKLLLLLLM